jgi:protein TonB
MQDSKAWFVTTIQRVKRSCSLIIVLMWIGSIPIWGQTGSVQDQLNSTYKGKILLLRNFYSGTDLEYDQNGVIVRGGSSGPWTLAYVEITGVTVSPQSIEVVGNRLGTLFQNGKPRPVLIGKVKIHIARPVSNIDAVEALHPIFGKILIEPGEDLRPLLPDYWKYYQTGTDLQARSAAWQADLDKSKIVPLKTAISSTGAPSAPKAVRTQDPKYTKEAASRHIEGRSVLGVVVDGTGTAVEIGILEPLGMGLDEQAVLALGQWKFRPATLNGQPVPVRTILEINFRCCP